MSDTYQEVEELVCELSEATESGFVATCIYNAMLANDQALSRTLEAMEAVKGSPQYKQQVKQLVKKIEAAYLTYSKTITRVTSRRVEFFSDVCQHTEEHLAEKNNHLYQCILKCFEDGGCKNAIVMAKAEMARTIAMFACLNLDRRMEEMRSRGIKEWDNIDWLHITSLYKLLNDLSERLFLGGTVNLNKDDTCKNALMAIERELTDARLIAQAITEGDKLNPATDLTDCE